MAGAWLPMRLDLHDDPAVVRVCAATGLDAFAVVGRLHRLWSWANAHLTDGVGAGLTTAWLDSFVVAPGFAAALTSAGWLTADAGGITFPSYDRWNSQGAKRRLKQAAATRGRRSGVGSGVSPSDGDARRHPMATPTATNWRPEESRGEKSTEDTPPPTPRRGGEAGSAPPTTADPKSRRRATATEPPEFARFYAAYPRKAKRPDAAKAFAKLKPDADLVAVILAKLELFKACPKWTEAEGRFVPYPATWLRGRCWEDDLPGGRPPANAAAATQRTEANLTASAQHAPPANWRQHPGGTSRPPVNAPPVSPESLRCDDPTPNESAPAFTPRQEAAHGVG